MEPRRRSATTLGVASDRRTEVLARASELLVGVDDVARILASIGPLLVPALTDRVAIVPAEGVGLPRRVLVTELLEGRVASASVAVPTRAGAHPTEVSGVTGKTVELASERGLLGHVVVGPTDDHALVRELVAHAAASLASALSLAELRAEVRAKDAAIAALEDLLGGAPAPSLLFDRELRVTGTNAAMRAWVGREDEACFGVAVRDLALPETPKVLTLLRRVLERPAKAAGHDDARALLTTTVATRAPRLARRTFQVEAHAVALGGNLAGGVVSFHETSVVVRDLLRAELEQRAAALLGAARGIVAVAEALAAVMVPDLGDWALVTLVEGSTLRNVAAAHRDARLRDSVRDLVLEHAAASSRRGLQWVLETKELEALGTDDVTLLAKQGDAFARRVERLGAGPVMICPLLQGEAVVGLLTVGRTLHDHGRVEQRAARAIASTGAAFLTEARRTNEQATVHALFEDFVGVVSRELGDPLSSITTRLFLAEHDDPRTHLEVVRKNVDRMREVLERLSQARLPGDARTPATCDATVTVQEVLAQEQAVIRAAGVRVATHLSPAVVRCGRERLTAVLSTFVRHATAEAPPGALLAVRVERDKERALFTVSDTGPGLTVEQARHAFDGLWMGERDVMLTAARAIVEAHGGRTWVESSPGTGAAYCFSLPLAG